MKLADFLAYLQGVKATTNGCTARCPAHDDRHPSLVVTEADDRLLIHCRTGCRTTDVLAAMGLDYPALFLESRTTKSTIYRTGLCQSEGAPSFHWNWRSQCAELERCIQAKREHAEAMLSATHGLDVKSLTVDEFDELMSYVGRAYGWLERCERLDETVYLAQQTMRAEERAERVIKRKGQVAA